MSPTLSDGDYVVSLRARSYKVGQMTIFDHPDFGRCVKRVVGLDPNRGVRLAGDSPNSASSEAIGWQPLAALLGRVLFSIRR